MSQKTKLSRRLFTLGLMYSSLAEAADPIIDLDHKVDPFWPSLTRKNLIDFDQKIIDMEPDIAIGLIDSTQNEWPIKKNKKKFTIDLKNANTGENLSYFIESQGKHSKFDGLAFDEFCRDWRDDEVIAMDKNLINILVNICEPFVDNQGLVKVDVLSGYRTKRTNEKLRSKSRNVAKNSFHLTGRALDFRVPNVSIETLRNTAHKEAPGGLGMYRNFIHIDTGPTRRWFA
ncbi:MAG: DUF882 domain-containing protein [Flavobacteriia bacterium]|nr:DUF882 domain-containing protein [Flavobacteriia bacterium]